MAEPTIPSGHPETFHDAFAFAYPRTAQRTDGTLITAYYWNDDPKKERHISATLWRAPEQPRASVLAAPVAGRHVVAHHEAVRFAGCRRTSER